VTREIRTFTLLLDEAFAKPAWHGPNLLGSLRGITVFELLYRPRKDGHNIWELALHCAYWKHAVRNRLVAGKRNSFPVSGSNFFPREQGLSAADWRKDLALLKRQHLALRAAILEVKPAAYGRMIEGSKHTVERTILGIAAHDIYHAGQISLLRRMARSGGRT
jgi:hypothetical protein